MLTVDKIVVGELFCNCYLISKDGVGLLVDPGDGVEKILSFLREKKVRLLAILITHGHADHIGGVDALVHHFAIPVYRRENLVEKEYQIGPFSFEVFFTPGHSQDSVCYYFQEEEMMFVGDFVFAGTIGRCDLPGGDMVAMRSSILWLKKFTDDFLFYPGHGPSTILSLEREHNPYFR